MTLDTFGPHITAVLKEMCSRVDVDFDDVDMGNDGWYLEHSWTMAEEAEFVTWFVEYLRDNSSARREIMSFPHKAYKHIRPAVSMFVMLYGWRSQED